MNLIKKKIFKSIVLISLVGIILIGFGFYAFLFPNITTEKGENAYLLIRESTSYEQVVEQLDSVAHVKVPFTFNLVAKILKYNSVHSGRYEVSYGMSNFELIAKLRSGSQTPVNISFNGVRTKGQLAARLSKQLMLDSVEFHKLLKDSVFLSKYKLDTCSALSLFIPDTYEVFWNIKAEKFFDRMNREYEAFWTEERKAKAKAIPLTQAEVSTLASIVESESNVNAEKPIIAGLYLNRIKKGMALQADPTVIFAVGDFSIRRVLKEHLMTESPYNTYKNLGLPPGPIRIPSAVGLDAVLNYAQHDYIFMCAKETFNGEHNFASSWAEHKSNARKYQKALNERGIK